MTKRITAMILTLIIIFTIVGCSQGGTNTTNSNIKYDFRNIKWGMTRDEVKASESATLKYDTTQYLRYECNVSGYSTNLIYLFNPQDKLVSSMYVLNIEHSNYNLYLDDYKTLYKELTNKYGTPTKEQDNWWDDLYKNRPSEYGKAIAYGDYQKLTAWKTDTTNIVLMIQGDNLEINLSIMYGDINVNPKNIMQKDNSGL